MKTQATGLVKQLTKRLLTPAAVACNLQNLTCGYSRAKQARQPFMASHPAASCKIK